MDPQIIRKILDGIASGKISPGEAYHRLKHLTFENLGFAVADHHRQLRTGLPEVIFAPGKTAEQILGLAGSMYGTGADVLITRAEKAIFARVKRRFTSATFNSDARIIHIPSRYRKQPRRGNVLVISAGTSDIPVAEEAAVTTEILGHNVQRVFDVGVAGIHRLVAQQKNLSLAEAIIVVAGMEGALPSVVAGLVDVPVIAVPTSVGYGASFKGVSALLAMLNSCVPGVVVVNIDNGFGAACAASLIIKSANKLSGGKT